jgi:hypothetical protein
MRYPDPSPDASGSSALAVFDESWTVIEVRQRTHSLTATCTRDSRQACRVERFDRGALVAAVIAAALGTASAAVSAYWALGGEALLDTVGGDIERWGRERSAGVVVAVWVIVALKLVGALAPLIFVGVGHFPAWTRSRRTRALGWAAAVGLTVYGGVLSVAGWLVEAGVVDAADDADEHALAWHAYFWDPWFALWGGAFVVAMWRSRPQPSG